MFDVQELLRLSTVPRIGPQRIRALVTRFKDPAEVFRASPRELVRVPGITEDIARTIRRYKNGDRFAREQLHRLNRINARIITIWEREYPELLKKIYDPPPFIFVLGAFEDVDNLSVALVGTRQPTPYGQIAAENFSSTLARLGITTVSGLARGIDTVVHTATLKEHGRTLAVIGSGLDVPYPPENQTLMQRIAESGAVITEFSMGAEPDPQNFPRRNRIISGLSLGTVVVESAEDGGAMITASTALDQNREVYAVPGNIGEKKSAGPHKLIREGMAKLVTNVDDILDELSPQLRSLTGGGREPSPPIDLTLFERKLLDILNAEASHIDSIAESAEISTADALVNLLSLEFKGLVKQFPGKMFLKL